MSPARCGTVWLIADRQRLAAGRAAAQLGAGGATHQAKNRRAVRHRGRGLPVPVVDRLAEGTLRLDLRCLSAADGTDFETQLAKLAA